MVNRHFQLRTCTDHVLHNRRRPCLQYQIKRCPAPCVLPVSRDEYGEQVRDVRLFLDGKSDELLDRLRGAHEGRRRRSTEFERAATVRDQIRALESSLESQRVVSDGLRRPGRDRVSPGGDRAGDRGHRHPRRQDGGHAARSRFTDQEFPDAEILSSFLGLYYDLSQAVPDEVLLPFAIADAELKAEWLAELRGAMLGQGGQAARRSRCWCPSAGRGAIWSELARKNAAASFASRRNARADAEADAGQAAEAAEAAPAAAGDRVLRHLARAGVGHGGVDGGVHRRQAGEDRATGRTSCTGASAPAAPTTSPVDVRGAVAAVAPGPGAGARIGGGAGAGAGRSREAAAGSCPI